MRTLVSLPLAIGGFVAAAALLQANGVCFSPPSYLSRDKLEEHAILFFITAYQPKHLGRRLTTVYEFKQAHPNCCLMDDEVYTPEHYPPWRADWIMKALGRDAGLALVRETGAEKKGRAILISVSNCGRADFL